MDNRELKDIIELIQASEGIDLSQIAQKAKVNRSHLSTIINSPEKREVSITYLGKLTKQFPAYFNGQHKPTQGGDITLSLREIANRLQNLENGQQYIRAEIRGYGQYQISKDVNWDQEGFVKAMVKVGKLIGANLTSDDLQDTRKRRGT